MLTFDPATLTRTLRHAGHPVSSVRELAPGAVRVYPALAAAGRDAQVRRLLAELIGRGYDAAVTADRTAVTITADRTAVTITEPELPPGTLVRFREDFGPVGAARRLFTVDGPVKVAGEGDPAEGRRFVPLVTADQPRKGYRLGWVDDLVPASDDQG